MKKQLLTTISCLLLTTGLTFGQTTSFSFNDNNGTPNVGTYNPNDAFTLSLYGTASGFTAVGFSLWLQAPTANGWNTAIQITSATFFQFPDPNQSGYPKSFTSTSGQRDPGYLTDGGDLGATANNELAEGFTGTAHLADYTFTLTNAPAGTYVLYTTTNSPKGSGMNEGNPNYVYYNAPEASYTITMVPEPSTWSLVAVGALGFSVLRRRRQRA